MFTNLLNETCNIERKTITQDIVGQVIENWAIIQSIKCRKSTQPSKPVVSDTNYKYSDRDFVFFVDVNTNIYAGDRVSLNGKIYDIYDVQTYDNESVPHHTEIYAKYVMYE